MKGIITILISICALQMHAQKWYIGTNAGYSGEDGIAPGLYFDVHAGHQLIKRISVELLYINQSTDKRISDYIPSLTLDTKSLIFSATNESLDPYLTFSRHQEICLGLKSKINQMNKSAITLFAGVNYHYLSGTFLSSFYSQQPPPGEEPVRIFPYSNSGYGVNIRLGYQYEWSESVFLSAEALANTGVSMFGLKAGVGFRF
jgi:hypothetical protein